MKMRNRGIRGSGWFLAIFMVAIGLAGVAANGGTINSAQSGNWTNTSTWFGGSVPTLANIDDARITSSHTVTISNPGASANSVGPGTLASTVGTLLITAGDLTAPAIKVADNGTGTFIQSNGTVTAATSFYMGAGSGNGRYELHGGSLSTPEIRVASGSSSRGVLYQDGGSITAGVFGVGVGTSCSGRYDLVSGTLTITNNSPDAFYLSNVASGTGVVYQSGGLLSVAASVSGKNLSIGKNGVAGYTLTGGTVDVANAYLCIGYTCANTNVIWQQTGGALTLGGSSQIRVGTYGQGNLLLGGGSVSSPTVNIGFRGVGGWTQTGGVVTAASTYLGHADTATTVGSTGTCYLTGGAFTNTGTLALSHPGDMTSAGAYSYGRIEQTGGTLFAADLRAGFYTNAVSFYSIASNSVFSGAVTLGRSGRPAQATFKVIGSSPTITCSTFAMATAGATYHVVLDAGGVSTLTATNTAALDGNLTVELPTGVEAWQLPSTVTIMQASNGLTGAFTQTNFVGFISGFNPTVNQVNVAGNRKVWLSNFGPPHITNDTAMVGAVSTTYGTASGATSFHVSGFKMSEGILVTPPQGYEVSLSSGSGYASSILVGSSGTINDTLMYVRLTSTAAVGSASAYDNKSIVLTSASATTRNVSTGTGNSVAKKPLSITAPTVTKVYDGGTSIGTLTLGALSGFVGSETVIATGVATTFASKNVGATHASTVSYTLNNGSNGGLAANYSLADSVIANASITPKALSISGTSVSKAYDGTSLPGTVTPGALSGFIGSETVTATGVADSYPSADFGSYPGIGVTYTLHDGSNGGLGANYSLASDSITATITPPRGSVYKIR